MADKSRTYRYPLMDKITSIVGAILTGSMAFIFWVNDYENRIVIVCLVFFALSLFSLIAETYTVTITEQELVVKRFFRVKKLAWDDIYQVIPGPRDSFSLSDRNGDIEILINPLVKDYLELVWLIKQRRPDIWVVRDAQTFQELTVFHQHHWEAIMYGFGSIGMVVAIFVIPSSGNIVIDNLGRLLFCIVGPSIFIMVARTPRKLEFQESTLILSFYGGWKKSIRANEVKGFYVKQENTRYTKVNLLYLELENGKTLTFGGYKEGMPMLVSAFEKWMKRYKPNIEQK